jgi:putative transposase
MPRPVRVEFAGAVYHVMARGNERREIFRDEKDRERFVETLAEAAEQFAVFVHAYCLMGNHYHLVLETSRANLGQTMAWLQTTYTVRFNRRHRRSGHLFQGRYKAQLVEADAYAQELVRYIHLNPVRSRGKPGVIPSERAQALHRYRWSSHREYAGWRRKPKWLCLQWGRYWGNTTTEAQRRYRQWMATAFDKPLTSPWENLRGGLVLGGERLWKKAQALVATKPRREESLWMQQHGRESAHERARNLAENEKDWRVKLWIRVRLGGERMTAVARTLDYRDGSGVAQVIKRLEQTANRDARLRKQLAQLRRNANMS